MNDRWEVRVLGEMVDTTRGISYGVVQPGGHLTEGVPIVRVTDIRHGRVAMGGPLRIDAAIEEMHSRTRLRGGELLLTLVGTVGETAVVGPELIGWNVARAVGVVPVVAEPGARWVHYMLQSRELKAKISEWCNTTVQTTLNLRDVNRIPILVPPPVERRRIEALLASLDDKVALNREVNETLEAMARALFKSWFVDFDPVRAKMAGHAPFGIDTATAALLPSSLDAGAPASWTTRPLDEVATFMNGLALQKFPAALDEPCLPVLKIAQLRSGTLSGADRASLAVPSTHHVHDGDLIFSWSGSLLVKIWTGGRAALNQHLFKVTSSRYPRWFIHGWLQHYLPAFQAIAADKATTMGHIQRHHLTEAMVVVPTAEVLAAVGSVIAPLESKLLANELESRTLADLRDLLLPKLLSGELRIRDAEKVVEAVI